MSLLTDDEEDLSNALDEEELSSLDEGHGDVHGVDEISDDDSSDVEHNEPDRGINGLVLVVFNSAGYWNVDM